MARTNRPRNPPPTKPKFPAVPNEIFVIVENGELHDSTYYLQSEMNLDDSESLAAEFEFKRFVRIKASVEVVDVTE
jgi:hypothetical protein